MNLSIEELERKGAEDALQTAIVKSIDNIVNHTFEAFIKENHFDSLHLKIIKTRHELLRIESLLDRLKTYNPKHN